MEGGGSQACKSGLEDEGVGTATHTPELFACGKTVAEGYLGAPAIGGREV